MRVEKRAAKRFNGGNDRMVKHVLEEEESGVKERGGIERW